METQEQEVEALKKWWRDNGRVVVVGVVLGLGGVIGWNWWQAYENGRAERASAMFAEVVNASNRADHAAALAEAKALLAEFPGSGYAALGALVGARSAYAAKLDDEAKGQLQWVIENAELPQIKDVARLRLARVLQGEQEADRALALLDAIETASFDAVASELRGDIEFGRGDPQAAAGAYRAALDSPDLDAASRQRLDLKLGDLGLGADEG